MVSFIADVKNSWRSILNMNWDFWLYVTSLFSDTRMESPLAKLETVLEWQEFHDSQQDGCQE